MLLESTKFLDYISKNTTNPLFWIALVLIVLVLFKLIYHFLNKRKGRK